MNQSHEEPVRVIPAGDAAALVVLGDEMSVEMSVRVQELARGLARYGIEGIRDVSPAYCTLLIHFDPAHLSFQAVQSAVRRLMTEPMETSATESRLREIPTVYGGDYGPDLPVVASQLQLSEAEVIRLHSGATYVVCTLGFAPGQPYVVGLPSQLALPRRLSPRELVPIGAVTLANQTNVYPFPNPTGWWWIGRTHLKLFDPSADPPTHLQPGDRMRFVPIDEAEYLRLGGEDAEPSDAQR
ncbi:MAG: 5-oxoprolinase subunit PxpB [Chloroflexota bacterium]